MLARLFDGRGWRECTMALAHQVNQDSSLSWVDLRLEGPNDPQAADLYAALGLDQEQVARALTSGPSSAFDLQPDRVEGVAWLSGDGGSAQQALFTFNGRRLVTVRTGGDRAFAQVQHQMTTRADLAIKQPSRVVGFVLQAMLATIQEDLTDLAVQIGALDLDIITESIPNPDHNQELVVLRQRFQPFAMRFPSYVMAVSTALIDPDTITALDAPGVAELQTFATFTRSTESMVMNNADAIRNAVQDLQGQVSTWQGNRINQLTVVTILFLPITFLTGYFGMNFTWIDNLLGSAVAYLALGLALPLAIVIASGLWLSRRGFRLSLKPGRKRPPR
jgi:Mg2+ and Co2+ transporter CorA